MFIFMIDDTQAPRGTNTPGGFGGADDTARSEGTATDGARGPKTEAVEASAP